MRTIINESMLGEDITIIVDDGSECSITFDGEIHDDITKQELMLVLSILVANTQDTDEFKGWQSLKWKVETEINGVRPDLN